MRHYRIWILSFCFMVSALSPRAQFDPKKVCRIEDGRLVFTLDQHWTAAQRKEISRLYDLDSALLAGAFSVKPVIKEHNNTWTTRKLDDRYVELSKTQAKTDGNDNQHEKIFLVDDKSFNTASSDVRESVPYGVNRLTRLTVVQLSAGKVRFFLPGHREARSVFLSGSFNGWATGKAPMQPVDSGWVTTLKLLPGKYTYKFILDGKWINDPYNKLREEDSNGGYNNVFFSYNYRFTLPGNPNARQVIVAGSFNDWNKKELRMIRFQGNWVLPLFLRQGTHAYKFVVDNKWTTDPGNKTTRPDGAGHLNSFIGIGDTTVFELKGYQGAGHVTLAGNFNGWNEGELFMEKTAGGWRLPYVLAPGNYEYKFVAGGKWITDPANPYFGVADDDNNSFVAIRPNHVFRLNHHPDAKKVILTGSFNGWSSTGYRMVEREGAWTFPLYLKPGKYTYKFIVDNKWILDPGNEYWEENEYHSGNSVIWIEP